MDQAEKIRENRLRKAARRQGMELQKSKRRDPRALDFGGYMLLDSANNSVVMGADPHPYSATIEQIEAWLAGSK